MHKKLSRSSLIVFFILLLFGLQTMSNSKLAAAEGTSRVMVEFSVGKKNAAMDVLSKVGGLIHYEFDHLNVIAVSLPNAALDGISRNPNIVHVEIDPERYLFGTGSSAREMALALAGGPEEAPYGVDAVQARDLWDTNRDMVVDAGSPAGAGVTVCVIDSGFYHDHEDLAAITNVDGYSQIPNEVWDEDGDSHGTHVAGTIAAVDNDLGVIGVAPNVSLYIIKIFGNDGLWVVNSSDLIDASQRCSDNGASVISMSLGGEAPVHAEQVQFDALDQAGVLSIAAAGNDGNRRSSYPASYASVVSVAATDSSNMIADFSQQNRQVELAAPGVGVLSTTSYFEQSTVTIDSIVYTGLSIENAAIGSASGNLVSGGLCDSVGSWTGMVVLCERGAITFFDKVSNVESGGGVAALIYNNEPGYINATLGEGNSSTIPALDLTQADGQFLEANKLGLNADVDVIYDIPATGYAEFDGTSMATPHVSAVAALIWSYNPSWTNQQIREAMQMTALDLGPAGLDIAYGYGLVQAYDAFVYLNGGPPPDPTYKIMLPLIIR